MEKFNYIRVLVAGVLLLLCCSTSAPDDVRFTLNSCCRFMLSFPIHFSRKLSTFDTIACNLSSSCNKHKCNCGTFSVVTFIRQQFSNITAIGFFFLAWSRQGIILVSFSWHCKAHGNVYTRFFRSFHVSNFTVPLFHIYPPFYLMQYDWLVPSMRLQVIQDSLFSRLGSGPFSGRGKRKSRNRTTLNVVICMIFF